MIYTLDGTHKRGLQSLRYPAPCAKIVEPVPSGGDREDDNRGEVTGREREQGRGACERRKRDPRRCISICSTRGTGGMPAGFAGLFADGATVVGFDGSLMNGPAEIDQELGRIFADHVTARYVGIVREVRFLAPDVAVLRAAAGLSPGDRRTSIRRPMRSSRCSPRGQAVVGASCSTRTRPPSSMAGPSWPRR